MVDFLYGMKLKDLDSCPSRKVQKKILFSRVHSPREEDEMESYFARVSFVAVRPRRVSAKDFQSALKVEAENLNQLLNNICLEGARAALYGEWNVTVVFWGRQKYNNTGPQMGSQDIGKVFDDYNVEKQLHEITWAELSKYEIPRIVEERTQFGLCAYMR